MYITYWIAYELMNAVLLRSTLPSSSSATLSHTPNNSSDVVSMSELMVNHVSTRHNWTEHNTRQHTFNWIVDLLGGQLQSYNHHNNNNNNFEIKNRFLYNLCIFPFQLIYIIWYVEGEYDIICIVKWKKSSMLFFFSRI